MKNDLNDSQEEAILNKILPLMHLSILDKVATATERFLIGVNDRQTENKWELAESPVRCGALRYSFWAPNEPNDWSTGEDCVAILKNKNPKTSWNDVPCNINIRPMFSICQIFI